MQPGDEVRVVDPPSDAYRKNGCFRKNPYPWLLGLKGTLESPTMTKHGEFAWRVRIENGQLAELYEFELTAFETTPAGGTRELPPWANDADELELRLGRVQWLGEPFDHAFGDAFRNEDEVRDRIARLKGVDPGTAPENEPPLV